MLREAASRWFLTRAVVEFLDALKLCLGRHITLCFIDTLVQLLLYLAQQYSHLIMIKCFDDLTDLLEWVLIILVTLSTVIVDSDWPIHTILDNIGSFTFIVNVLSIFSHLLKKIIGLVIGSIFILCQDLLDLCDSISFSLTVDFHKLSILGCTILLLSEFLFGDHTDRSTCIHRAEQVSVPHDDIMLVLGADNGGISYRISLEFVRDALVRSFVHLRHR